MWDAWGLFRDHRAGVSTSDFLSENIELIIIITTKKQDTAVGWKLAYLNQLNCSEMTHFFLFYFTENAEAESSNKISKVTTIAIIVPSLCFLIFILTAVIILRGVCKRRSQWASSSHSFTLFYAIAITNKVFFFLFLSFLQNNHPAS